jgi:hypothetical protein
MSYTVQNNLQDAVTLLGQDISNKGAPVTIPVAPGGVARGNMMTWSFLTNITVDGIVFDTYPLPTGAYSLNAQSAFFTAMFAYGANMNGPGSINCPNPSVTTTMTASATPGATLTFTSDCTWLGPNDGGLNLVIKITGMSKSGGGNGGGGGGGNPSGADPSSAPKKKNNTAIYIGVGVALVVLVIIIIALYEHRQK